ncbi:MAG: Trigger factor [Planctomycetes bacterium]|nr:Trigger factor [Planctomycetota bacterium]
MTSSASSSASAPAIEASVEETGPCSRKLAIRVPAARVDHEYESALKSVMGSVQFDGFRQGRVPRRLVEARLGGRVLDEVKERLVQTALEDVIKEKKLQPVGNPRMDWGKLTCARGADMAFDIALDVRPTVKLPKLDELAVKRPDLTVTDAQIDAEVESLRMDRAETRDAGDEPLRAHGICTLAVKITSTDANGAEQTVVEADDVEWQLGSDVLGGMLIAGLDAGILGKKKGDTVEFRQPLPADFRDEQWRGKDAVISVRIDAAQHVDLPEVTDAFAKDMDYDSVEDMRKELRKKLERQAESSKERALDEAIVDALLAAAPFDVPPSLVTSETERMLRRYEAQLRQQGVPDQDIALQLQQMVSAAATRVTRDLRASFVLDEVARDRKVLVTETEMRQEIARIAARYNRSTNDMEEMLENQGILSSLRVELRERKTVAELRGVVKISD